jgi:hypothetical protein
MQEKNKIKYYSLYEYLGRAAGPELGKEVNAASKRTKQPIVTQHVEHGGYKGKVFCYTTKFLDEYFHAVDSKGQFSLKLEDDDLPF